MRSTNPFVLYAALKRRRHDAWEYLKWRFGGRRGSISENNEYLLAWEREDYEELMTNE